MTCRRRAALRALRGLMCLCLEWTHLRRTIKNLIQDHNSLLLLTMLSTYRACQFHSRLHQCLSRSTLIESVSAPYQRDRDKYQHPPLSVKDLQLDRIPSPHTNLLDWMSASSKGSVPHSRMRYVTWAAEVAMFPVCRGAPRLMGNDGERPFVLPLKELVG